MCWIFLLFSDIRNLNFDLNRGLLHASPFLIVTDIYKWSRICNKRSVNCLRLVVLDVIVRHVLPQLISPDRPVGRSACLAVSSCGPTVLTSADGRDGWRTASSFSSRYLQLAAISAATCRPDNCLQATHIEDSVQSSPATLQGELSAATH